MPLDPEEAQNALQALNIWIDSLGANNLMPLANVKQAFSLTGGEYIYTIGIGGNFNTVKPTRIIDGFTRDTYGVDRTLEIRDMQWYDLQEDKSFVSAPPSDLAYDPGPTQQVVPVGIVYFYPIPDSSNTYTVYLGTDNPFTEFTYLTDVVTFPAAYYRMLKFNLAVELWPDYHHREGQMVPRWLQGKAEESVREVESMNVSTARVTSMIDVPGTKTGIYNIESDRPD
jgi:hypothetical protein